MYYNLITLAVTSSGKLSICEGCQVFHFIFNNLYFEFNVDQYLSFKDYLNSLEIDYWEHKYATCDFFQLKTEFKSDRNCSSCKSFKMSSCANPDSASPSMLCGEWAPQANA